MSLNTLKFLKIDHNLKTGICDNCSMPLVEAELISYVDDNEIISVEVDLTELNKG
jgi:RNase P subunit RPR2